MRIQLYAHSCHEAHAETHTHQTKKEADVARYGILERDLRSHSTAHFIWFCTGEGKRPYQGMRQPHGPPSSSSRASPTHPHPVGQDARDMGRATMRSPIEEELRNGEDLL